MIKLTTPMSLGDVDPNPHTHIKIQKFTMNIEQNYSTLETRYGYLVDGVFTKGVEVPGITTVGVSITDADYVSLVTNSKTKAVDAPVYSEVSDLLYQFLLDNEKFVGTVV